MGVGGQPREREEEVKLGLREADRIYLDCLLPHAVWTIVTLTVAKSVGSNDYLDCSNLPA